MPDIKTIADNANIVVNGYAFTREEDGIHVLSDLSEAMRLGKLGEQVVLKSKKAFDALTFVEGIKAPREEYFAKYKQRDEEARGKYRTIATKPVVEDATYVIDIIRNNWKNGQGI